MIREIHTSFFSVHRSFSALLEGGTRVMKPSQIRTLAVSFTPQKGGLCEAILELTFHDHKRSVDFVVNRTLTGQVEGPRYQQNGSVREPGSRPVNNGTSHHRTVPVVGKEEFLDSSDTGISVSREDGLDFGIVERKRINGPFATPSSLLTIKLAEGFPPVTFVKEKTRTLDGSDPEYVILFCQLCLDSSLQQVCGSFRG